MYRWQAKEILKSSVPTTVGVVTASPVSLEIDIPGDPNTLRIEALVSGINHVGTQTLLVEQRLHDGSFVAISGASVAVTTTGMAVILISPLNPAYATLLPMSDKIRVSLTQTNALDSLTLSSIKAFRLV